MLTFRYHQDIWVMTQNVFSLLSKGHIAVPRNYFHFYQEQSPIYPKKVNDESYFRALLLVSVTVQSEPSE
ncbi:MAG: hypothetical protein ABIR06_06150 [Cyclobacteriaceae bacterium]